jgi:hypothetical protein
MATPSAIGTVLKTVVGLVLGFALIGCSQQMTFANTQALLNEKVPVDMSRLDVEKAV